MAPAFIFAEQVLSIVRSGKKEIEIPEGARISSAAADLIKEHQIQIKTVAPGLAASGETSASKANRKKQPGPSAENRNRIRSLKIPLKSLRKNLKKSSTGLLNASIS